MRPSLAEAKLISPPRGSGGNPAREPRAPSGAAPRCVTTITGFFITLAYDEDSTMAHSYVSSVFHVVFSTKERAQLISPDLQPRLWNYLAGIALNHEIHVLAIGGTQNHVHV